MASSSTTTSCIFTFSLIFFSAFASACNNCKPSGTDLPNPTLPTLPTLPPLPNPTDLPTLPPLPNPTDLPTLPPLPPLPGTLPNIPSLPTLAPSPSVASESCPLNALKLGVCANLLGGLVNIVVGGAPSGSKCCTVLEGLVDLEAALCLCTAINANVLGINLNVPVTLGLLVSACDKILPEGFTCPSS